MHKKFFTPKKVVYTKKIQENNAKEMLRKVHNKVWSLLKVPIIVPKRVPFPQKSYQFSALKSAPKKFKKKVPNGVL